MCATSASRPRSRWMAPMPCIGAPTIRARTCAPTDSADHLTGCGLTFTNGRGTEIVVAAVRALEHLVVGRTLGDITTDMRHFWRSLTSEDQLRWLGPEKGVIHLATGAVVNAVWDLWAKSEGKPLLQAPCRARTRADRRRRSTSATSRTLCHARRRSSCWRRMRAGREARLARSWARRLSRLYDLGRVARLRRREDRNPGARGGRGRLHAREDEGRPGRRTRMQGAPR